MSWSTSLSKNPYLFLGTQIIGKPVTSILVIPSNIIEYLCLGMYWHQEFGWIKLEPGLDGYLISHEIKKALTSQCHCYKMNHLQKKNKTISTKQEVQDPSKDET